MQGEKPLIAIGSPDPQAPPTPNVFQQPPPGQPVPAGMSVYDANFEFTARNNALALADDLRKMAMHELDADRKVRMNKHADQLIDNFVAPPLDGA